MRHASVTVLHSSRGCVLLLLLPGPRQCGHVAHFCYQRGRLSTLPSSAASEPRSQRLQQPVRFHACPAFSAKLSGQATQQGCACLVCTWIYEHAFGPGYIKPLVVTKPSLAARYSAHDETESSCRAREWIELIHSEAIVGLLHTQLPHAANNNPSWI